MTTQATSCSYLYICLCFVRWYIPTIFAKSETNVVLNHVVHQCYVSLGLMLYALLSHTKVIKQSDHIMTQSSFIMGVAKERIGGSE